MPVSDLSHTYGSDFELSSTGGLLLLVDGGTLLEQRLDRRIFTNPKDDNWSPDYGLGAPQYIGLPASSDRIKARILKNMRAEADVDLSQPINVVVTTSDTGLTTADIQYTIKATQQSWQQTVTL